MARAPRLRPPLQRGRASPRWQAGPAPGRGAAADRGDPGASTGSIACAAPTAAAPRGQSCRPRSQAAPSARDWRPRSQALPVRNRVSRRDLVELVEELFGCTLASGTVDAIVQRTGHALAVPYDGLLGHIRDASAVNVDETGWRLRGGRRTLWGALTCRAAVFRIAPDRHERELLALLGEEFAGIACSDRWWAYSALEPERRQVCWAHYADLRVMPTCAREALSGAVGAARGSASSCRAERG